MLCDLTYAEPRAPQVADLHHPQSVPMRAPDLLAIARFGFSFAYSKSRTKMRRAAQTS